MTRNVRRGTVRVVKAGGTARRKLREWVRRYLPCELAGTRGGRIPGDGLIGRGGDRRDYRRVGRLLRGGLRERVAPQLPRPRRQALAVTRVEIKPARAAQR